MGSFNTLITELTCPDCGQQSQARIQFKFGNNWQFEYRTGETITWGGNDMGDPNHKKVKLYGIIELTHCPYCNKNSIPEEYDIFVADNVIVGFSPIESIEDYLDGNGESVPLNN